MDNLDRNDVEWISGNSNWSESGVSKTLREQVHSDAHAWRSFLSRSLLGVGTAFTLAGIFFFFAYNWDRLHRFAKLGLLEGLLLILVACLVLAKAKPLVKKVLLTAASLIVGALYAVYGQVYQTGADAYELFMAWALLIALWTLIANFAPLWLLFIALVDIGLYLYVDQVAHPRDPALVDLLFFGLNALVWAGFELLPKGTSLGAQPPWLINLLALTVVLLGTLGVSRAILDPGAPTQGLLIGLVLSGLIAALWYGIRSRQLFYLAIIPFGLLVMVCALMLHISDAAGMLLAMGLLIVGSMAVLVRTLMHYQRKWTN